MESPLDGVVQVIAMAMLCIAASLGLVRLYLGPSLPDRVLALDFITMMSIGLIALYAIATDRAILLDVAIALALIVFLATVAFATLLERSTFARRRRRGSP